MTQDPPSEKREWGTQILLPIQRTGQPPRELYLLKRKTAGLLPENGGLKKARTLPALQGEV